jgi:hypothetical protein
MYRHTKSASSLAVAALLVLALGTPTDAAHSVKITNAGTKSIDAIYVSTGDDSDWGNDRLGKARLQPGQSRVVQLDDGCRHDILAVYDDGAKRERYKVDTCGRDREVIFRR